MSWQCESCLERHSGEPAYTETHRGYDETVELRFCEDCTVRV